MVAVRARPGKSITAYVLGDLANIYFAGRSQIRETRLAARIRDLISSATEESLRAIDFDSFLADQFSRRVQHRYEYKVTAAYARFVFGIGAVLIYPSVAANCGMNIALPSRVFDEKFEVILTELMPIKRYLGYNLWGVERVSSTCEFDKEGHPIWNSDRRVPHRYITGSLEVSPEFKGRRV